MSVSAEVLRNVRDRLAVLEAAEDVRVLFAVESGSRAWGFASRDSDYDVRFVYVRRPEWYLSIRMEERRDVIERAWPAESLDVSGWDVRKALGLFARSNPPLVEWLDSPWVYADRYGFADGLRALLPAFHSPRRAMHHYFHMARGNFRDSLHGPPVRQKKYFYVLRPVLACRWIEQGRGPVPMEFQRLLVTVSDRAGLLEDVAELLRRKRAGDELDGAPRIDSVHEFLDGELVRLEGMLGAMPDAARDQERLDGLFRALLSAVWGDRPAVVA